MNSKNLSPLTRALLLLVGLLSLGLGVIGIFLPLLPTTPFLLLSAYCFIRSSPTLYNWLVNNKALGHYIHNYIENRAIEPRVKWFTVALLWGSILTSAITLSVALWVKALLIAIAIGVTVHIFRLN
ncbi:MAG: YbaN family protein [Bacteroidales bacterium]